MSQVDIVVLVLYLAGTLAVSVVASARTKSSDQMFVAGGESPWWAAGLSGFMTMFSAGTFVVWGGIAFKYGAVAVAINLCYGLAALGVGATVAGRWNSVGIRTPAEFIEVRFGRTALQFYVATMIIFKIVGSGVSIYALSVILADAMQTADGQIADGVPAEGSALPLAICVLGGTVVFYTVVGGLWGILMTDVLQFIVLNLTVLFVIPLAMSAAGGVNGIVAAAPDGFFRPTGGGYTWWFLAGWTAIHYFVVGAEWAFVQRYLCVASPRDARKGCYLFGVLYLVSPLAWFLPPMAYRAMTPIPDQGLSPALVAALKPGDVARLAPAWTADPDSIDVEKLSPEYVQGLRTAAVNSLGETAYIRVCREVLPTGMMGMMLAAMFSATASTVSGHLNVFAGVLTNDFYARWKRRTGQPPDERQLVRAGRAFTVALGAMVVATALSVQSFGGAERVIVAITSFMTVPLLAPVLVGLISRRITSTAVWLSAGSAGLAAVVVKVLFAPGGMLARRGTLADVSAWLVRHDATVEIGLGVGIPILALVVALAVQRCEADGAKRITSLTPPLRGRATPAMHVEIVGVVAWSLAACSAVVGSLVFANDEHRGLLAGFACGLGVLSMAAFRASSPAPTARLEGSHASE
ncbi:MAG: Na+:solute symporter [Pirellulales bacterium]|nr:Na+:solute symporter [Pirellulales bacterium]